METVMGSFVLVALSEMGDKTQLLAFSLAARFKQPWAVMAGILAATILNHALAATLGTWIATYLTPAVLAYLLAGTFFLFGLWTLRPDSLDSGEHNPSRSAFLTTTFLFFLAEMGDKTQFATVALAARYQSAVLVTIGTTAGMLFSDGLAVFVGEKLAERINMNWVRWIAAGLFFVFGALSLVSALRGGR